MSKIKEIESLEDLLEVLHSEQLFESYPGFSAYFRILSQGNAEFRAQIGHEKLNLKLRPVLQATRRVLKGEGIRSDELLACPHIAEPFAVDLRQASVPHVDLNGRLFLRTEGSVIDLRPAEARYRSPRKGPDPFSSKATRIIRALLCSRGEAITQEEFVNRTGASRALVSQVLKQLIDDDLVRQLSASAPGHPAYYQLANFDGLLDAWVRADRWQTRTTVHEYSILSNKPEEIATKLVESVGSESLAFTQWFAAWQRRPHTVSPVVSCYVKKRAILEIVPARSVKSGGNLWLIVPEDEGVWQEGQEVNDFPLVSDVQIYLDLLQVSQRGPEQADELRKWEGFAR